MVRNPLTVCVLGSSMPRAARLICELISSNSDQIRTYTHCQTSFVEQDGTRYKAESFQVLYRQGMQGVRLDQIIVDPYVLRQPMYQVVRVLELLDNACAGSDIPDEFRWIWLDEERG